MTDFDPLEASGPIDQVAAPPQTTREVAERLEAAAAAAQVRVGAYTEVADLMYALWERLPEVSTREVDGKLREIHAKYIDLGVYLGASRGAVKELRDCCGGRKPWPGTPEPVLGWGVGDIVRRITRALGIRHCETCERRRTFLNRLFGKKT